MWVSTSPKILLLRERCFSGCFQRYKRKVFFFLFFFLSCTVFNQEWTNSRRNWEEHVNSQTQSFSRWNEIKKQCFRNSKCVFYSQKTIKTEWYYSTLRIEKWKVTLLKKKEMTASHSLFLETTLAFTQCLEKL